MNRDWLADHNPVSWNALFPKEKMEGANSKSFMLHPFDSPKLAVAIFENKNATAFSSKVRLDSDPNSPVRFAVRASGKILWQSKDLVKKGDMDECWVDIRNHSEIELLTRCKYDKTFATAIWHYPHFIKTEEYDNKIKETGKFLDYSSVIDYWRAEPGLPSSNQVTDSFDAKALATTGHAIYSLVRFKNGIPEAYFAGDVVENSRLASQGWKSLGMIGKGCTIPQKDTVWIKRLPNSQGIPEYPQYFIGIPPNDKIRNSGGFGLVWLEPKPGLIECLLMRTKQEGLFSLATDKQEIAARMKTGQWTIEKRFYILPPD